MASPYPVLEIAIVNIKGQDIENESTKEGKMRHEIFKHVTSVPGLSVRVGEEASEITISTSFVLVRNVLFQSGQQPADLGPLFYRLGIIQTPLRIHGSSRHSVRSFMELPSGPFDMYHITPNTEQRAALYAPYSAIVLFWGIDEAKFAELVKPWITSIEKSDSCLDYLWGEVKSPARVDTSKNLELEKGVIMLSGWKSKEEHDHDCSQPRVVNSFKALQAAVMKSD
ncbi:uncharacterized protein PAC_19042 [Phialocephala subalpina]|uniref:Uncharacterized protein n=1 Tax=Phialocephala subalpina TaxID=576137 RepID=A0A1L7XVR0_9HELO|nr:uncharacterized protein PAC_19042 [Phialocephala subalpina]